MTEHTCLHNYCPACSAKVARLRAALEQLAECDLHPGNCADLSVATRRIRNIARAALGIPVE